MSLSDQQRLQFRPLASSSAGCCYEVTYPGCSPILLDAGVPYHKLQKLVGFKLTRFDACLVTHAHGDHSKGVVDLMTRAGLDCYGSYQTWNQVFKAPFESTGPAEHLWHRKAKVLTPNTWCFLNSWRFLGFPVEHDSPGTLGYILGVDTKLLLYLTDSPWWPQFGDFSFTHLAVECNFDLEALANKPRADRIRNSHMSLERLVEYLRGLDLSRVDEIHLLHLSDSNSHEARFKRAIQEATGKPTYVAPKFHKDYQ